MKILITGSEGLIGTYLSAKLIGEKHSVVPFDIALDERFNILNDLSLADAILGCEGVVHLAAVSRVVWGEQNPDLCWKTNAEGTRNVLQVAANSPRKPWVMVASSREVYGQPENLPANEDCMLAPINIYGRAKVQGEQYTLSARESGIRTAIIRLSNVYGSIEDHHDRVVPAFTRAAACGKDLRLDGRDNTFDFTYIDDVTDGLMRIINLLHQGEEKLPPIQLVSSQATTLKRLADLAISAGNNKSKYIEAPSRHYDVARFYGDPTRAQEILGWKASTSIEIGVSRMVEAFSAEASSILSHRR